MPAQQSAQNHPLPEIDQHELIVVVVIQGEMKGADAFKRGEPWRYGIGQDSIKYTQYQ